MFFLSGRTNSLFQFCSVFIWWQKKGLLPHTVAYPWYQKLYRMNRRTGDSIIFLVSSFLTSFPGSVHFPSPFCWNQLPAGGWTEGLPFTLISLSSHLLLFLPISTPLQSFWGGWKSRRTHGRTECNFIY